MYIHPSIKENNAVRKSTVCTTVEKPNEKILSIIFSIEKHKLQAEQSLERKRGVGSEMKQDLLEKYYCIFAKNKKYFHVLIFFYFKIC